MNCVYRSTLLLAVALAFTGCGPSRKLDMPPLHPVKGSVSFRGRPTAGVRVIFNPITDIGKIKYAPVAITDDSGAYQITSLIPGDGAPVGEYAVTFEWPDHINDPLNPDPTPEIDRFRGVYANAGNTQFKVTVQAGENTVPQFNLR
jgi:hypothetical protein